VIDLGLLKGRSLIWLSRLMEKFIYRHSDVITVHSEGNKDYLTKNGARAARVEVVHNWVDTAAIAPGDRHNDFSRKYGLAGKFVVSYAGTIGFAQGLEVMIDAAALLRDKKDILFILVGSGVKKNELAGRTARLGLSNVNFIETQPLAVYPQILNASDVSLVTLPSRLSTPAVPGKLLSIMAAAKPVIASVPLAGDAPKIIKKYNCGVCLPPDSPDELAKAVINLYNKLSLREEMGKNGRRAAEEVFSRGSAVKRYERIFAKITAKTFKRDGSNA